MTDIVEWLRGKPMVVNENGYTGISVAGGTLLNKAADEIERLREALQKIASKNPFHNQCPPINNVQFYSQVIVEMVGIANAALKEKE